MSALFHNWKTALFLGYEKIKTRHDLNAWRA